jgi:ubiquinone/menaquinone biosynthesis C-methylase UbiE
MNNETAVVQDWWNKNPFTYNKDLGVGAPDQPENLPLEFFEAAEQKYLKHSGGATWYPGQPVFSKYVPYSELSGKKVLDIATGSGFATVGFAKAGADVTGIDLTDFAVRETKRNFELRGLSGTVIQMDAQQMSFADNTFDFACAHGCLMHMPNTKQAVGEIFRVLKPGGEVYAWMYHKGWYYWFGMFFLRGILLGKLFQYRFDTLKLTSRYSDGAHLGGNPHTKFMSRRQFKKLFAEQGFVDIKLVTNYNPHEWSTWPTRSFGIGHYLPVSVQRFCSETLGFGFDCSILAKKPEAK